MADVLTGFAIIGIIILVGYLLARRGILTDKDGAVLSRLTFLVTNPVLLFSILAGADLAEVFSVNLAATVASVVVTMTVYVLVDIALVRARKLEAPTRGERLISSLSGVYVNAGNLGLPVATYVLGNPAYMAPALLLQLLVLQPTALALLDMEKSARGGAEGGRARRGVLGVFTMPFRNPMTVGSGLGVVFSLAHWSLPAWLAEPVTMVGNMAVPSMLLAFGISLVYGPMFGASGSRLRVGVASICKLFVQPGVAWVAATWLGGSAEMVFAATVTAALPSAQNLFVISTRYGSASALVRDVILATTFASMPVIFVLSVLLR